MLDPMTLIQSIGPIVGKATDIAKTLKNRELLAVVTELQQKLLELQQTLHEVLQERDRLRTQVAEWQRLDQIAEDLEFQPENGFYVRKSESDQGSVIPYCPLCWDDKRKLIHLIVGLTPGTYCCPADGSSYWTEQLRRSME